MSRNNSIAFASRAAIVSLHPAVTYLNALFHPNDTICLTFVHATERYLRKDGKIGGAVTENCFLPLSKVITPAGIARLTKRNEDWHIYVSMAPFKPGSRHRTKPNISEVRHVFIEADGNGEEALANVRASITAGEIPAPTLIVQSSPHKYHIIWNVVGFSIPEQVALNRTLSQKFDTDKATVDAARVLRVAGFRNVKPKYADPKPVAEIIEHNETPLWDATMQDFNIPLTSRPDNTVYPIASSAAVQQSIDLLEAAMNAASVSYSREVWEDSGDGDAFKFILAVCPWRADHENGSDGDAMAFVQPSGAFGFVCLHAHCADRDWTDFRKHLESLAGHKLSFTQNGKPKSCASGKESKPETQNPFSGQSGTSPTAPQVEIVESEITDAGIKDMPKSVLDGWLGTVCQQRMLEHFPVAYAWIALVTVASAMVPIRNGMRCNLFGCPVGPVHGGKSEAIKHAKLILGIQPPTLLDLMAGSAEMLTSAVASAGGQPRLYSTDELGHLLEKAQIQNSSFVYVLNRAFYETGFKVRSMERKKREVVFDATLSILGGVVEERFDDLFTAKTTGGFYDRFLYGLHPTGFRYFYTPFEGGPARQIEMMEGDPFGEEIVPSSSTVGQPVPVRLDNSVFHETKHWMQEDEILKNPECSRVVEIALRVATICASFDRRPVLYAKDLGPAFDLARYQARIRGLLKPNPGKTFEGQLYHKFFETLTMHTHDGRWMLRTELFRQTHAYEIGLGIANKTLDSMIFNGDVEPMKQEGKSGSRMRYVRIVRTKRQS